MTTMKVRGINSIHSNLIFYNKEDGLRTIKSSTNKYSTKKLQNHHEVLSEQTFFYFLFDLFEGNNKINDVIQKIVDVLPSCAQFSDKVSVRIVFNNSEFRNNVFNESLYSLTAAFKTFHEKEGKLEIFYKSELNNKNTDVAFIEAQLFIKGIVKVLVSWLNRLETESELERMLVQLEMKIESRTEQLKKANEKLIDINKDINDSINYANRIQRAILPTNSIINQVFEEAFVFYKPKDIVSGDFYWLHKSGSKIFYACADCTGHGVPGALMSMVGHQLLDHIITDRKITEPDRILEVMDSAIINLFKKSEVSDHLRDGMAMSLCVVDVKEKQVTYSGAYNDAYMFVDNDIITLKADRQYIGSTEIYDGKKFNKTVKKYSDGDLIYMFTDGFPDQFGGSKGKKLMRKKLLNLVTQNKNDNMDLQGKMFEDFFDNWKGNNFQVDDVTLLGVKL